MKVWAIDSQDYQGRTARDALLETAKVLYITPFFSSEFISPLSDGYLRSGESLVETPGMLVAVSGTTPGSMFGGGKLPAIMPVEQMIKSVVRRM